MKKSPTRIKEESQSPKSPSPKSPISKASGKSPMDKSYKPNTNFREVYALFNFDRQIRNIFFKRVFWTLYSLSVAKCHYNFS